MKILFSVLAVSGVLLPILAPFNNRQAGRRLFWTGFLVATMSAFLVAYPPDWKGGAWIALTAALLMLLTAYFSTSHLKFRGKIYAFNLKDSEPDAPPGANASRRSEDPNYDPAPDSYGGMATAKKTWWLIVCAIAMCVLAVVIRAPDKPLWLAPVMATAGVVIAITFGYGDATWDYQIARGQRIQFVAISIITVGVFAVLYFAAYRAGKRWSLRRKQSMEYRAHPRHQKKYP